MQSKPEKLAKLLREGVLIGWGTLWWDRVSVGQFPLPAPGQDYSWGNASGACILMHDG